MVKAAAAQDPYARPRPCPLSLERCWALCTGNLGQAVACCALCSKSADTKLDILNSSCSVLFNYYFNYHRLATTRRWVIDCSLDRIGNVLQKVWGSMYCHCILAICLGPVPALEPVVTFPDIERFFL